MLSVAGVERSIKQFTIERRERDSIDESMIDSNESAGSLTTGLKNWHNSDKNSKQQSQVLLEIDHEENEESRHDKSSGEYSSEEEDLGRPLNTKWF